MDVREQKDRRSGARASRTRKLDEASTVRFDCEICVEFITLIDAAVLPWNSYNSTTPPFVLRPITAVAALESQLEFGLGLECVRSKLQFEVCSCYVK